MGSSPTNVSGKVVMKIVTEADYREWKKNAWDKIPIKGIYESWTPDDLPKYLKQFYSIEFANQHGCDTGRKRFKVTCLRCSKVLHEATTGPNEYVKQHETECVG